jgi:hypothetical protein
MENGAALAASRDPNPAVVVLDNRVADGKAHPHAVVFGRKHGLEDLSEVGRTNSNPGILDRHLHAMGTVQSGCNGQLLHDREARRELLRARPLQHAWNNR